MGDKKNITITPIEDRVLIEKIAGADITEGGLVLPDAVTKGEVCNNCRILAVGPGKANMLTGERIPMQCKKGDIITFATYAATEIEVNKNSKNAKILYVMREPDLLYITSEADIAPVMNMEKNEGEKDA